MASEAYEEFALLPDNASEAGLTWTTPVVERRFIEIEPGRRIGAIVWGDAPPEIVLVHGGAQNAHTWDTVALALDRPLVALDLPGHGHSDWRDDHDYSPRTSAVDLESAIRALAPEARLVVGMSLGGLTALALSVRAPELVRRLMMVDVTPGTDREKAEPIAAFIAGPEVFADFDEILERTMAFNPTRSESSLRRGILHNARRSDDGSLVWRYDRTWAGEIGEHSGFESQWTDVECLGVPTMLVRGSLSGVVSEEDVEEFERRCPHARVVVVDDAGHSVQGDRPIELSELIGAFLDDRPAV